MKLDSSAGERQRRLLSSQDLVRSFRSNDGGRGWRRSKSLIPPESNLYGCVLVQLNEKICLPPCVNLPGHRVGRPASKFELRFVKSARRLQTKSKLYNSKKVAGEQALPHGIAEQAIKRQRVIVDCLSTYFLVSISCIRVLMMHLHLALNTCRHVWALWQRTHVRCLRRLLFAYFPFRTTCRTIAQETLCGPNDAESSEQPANALIRPSPSVGQ